MYSDSGGGTSIGSGPGEQGAQAGDGLAAVAAGVLGRGIKFARRQPVAGVEEDRVVAEALRATRRQQNLAEPA